MSASSNQMPRFSLRAMGEVVSVNSLPRRKLEILLGAGSTVLAGLVLAVAYDLFPPLFELVVLGLILAVIVKRYVRRGENEAGSRVGLEPDSATSGPIAEVLVEGELSPFEHEALYKLLKKHFRLEQPVYSELLDETVGTRIIITFHHLYDRGFFTDIFQEDWRGLKELFKQIRYRRGRLGAAFTLTFADEKIWLSFSLGLLEDEELGSAMDQIGHLTGIVGQMMRPETMVEPLGQVGTVFDPKTDRWQRFHGVGMNDRKDYVFDESTFRWRTG